MSQTFRRWGRLIASLIIISAVFTGCESETPVTPLVLINGTITDAAWASGDFKLEATNSVGAVLHSSTITGTTGAVPFSLSVPANSGIVTISAYTDEIVDGAFDYTLERLGKVVGLVETLPVTGLAITMTIHVLVSGTVTHGGWTTGGFVIVGFDGPNPAIANPVALATATGSIAASSYSMLVPASFGTLYMFAFNDQDGDGQPGPTWVESYGGTSALVAAIDLTAPGVNLMRDWGLTGAVSQPAWVSGETHVVVKDSWGGMIVNSGPLPGGTTVPFGFGFPGGGPGEISVQVWNDADGDTFFTPGLDPSVETSLSLLGIDRFNMPIVIVPPGVPGAPGFEAGMPAGWVATGLWHVTDGTSIVAGGGPDFMAAKPGFTLSEGTGAAWYGNETTANYNVPAGVANSGTLTSPDMILDANPLLTFDSAMSNECGFNVVAGPNGCYFDSGIVQVSADYWATWTDVAYAVNSYDGVALGWRPMSVDLSAFASQTVQVRFSMATGDGTGNAYTGWLVDRIKVW